MCFGSGGGGGSPPPPDPHLQAYEDTLTNIMNSQYQFQKENYQPVEKQMIADAERYRSPEYAAQQAAQAEGDVTKQYANQRSALAMDPLTNNPNNPQYAATQRGLAIAQAGQTAAAGTTARTNAQNTGFNVEAGIAGRGDAKINQAIGAAGVGGQLANQNYANQLQGWGMQQNFANQNSAGLGSLIGTIGGIAAPFFLSSKKFKTDVKPYKGGLDAVGGMKVKRWRYKEGTADGGEHEHIGPMAEDFHSATGVGTDKVIHVGDAIGTLMHAVQELHAKVQKLEKLRATKREPATVTD